MPGRCRRCVRSVASVASRRFRALAHLVVAEHGRRLRRRLAIVRRMGRPQWSTSTRPTYDRTAVRRYVAYLSRLASSLAAASPARPRRCGDTSVGRCAMGERRRSDARSAHRWRRAGSHACSTTASSARCSIGATRGRTRMASPARRCRARDAVRQRGSRLASSVRSTSVRSSSTTGAGRCGARGPRSDGSRSASPVSTRCGVARHSPRRGRPRGGPGAVRQRAWPPTHAARRSPDPRPSFTEPDAPARAAPHLRNASARRWGRPPRRPGAARPHRRCHHPALHSRQPRPAPYRLSRGPSSSMSIVPDDRDLALQWERWLQRKTAHRAIT